MLEIDSRGGVSDRRVEEARFRCGGADTDRLSSLAGNTGFETEKRERIDERGWGEVLYASENESSVPTTRPSSPMRPSRSSEAADKESGQVLSSLDSWYRASKAFKVASS